MPNYQIFGNPGIIFFEKICVKSSLYIVLVDNLFKDYEDYTDLYHLFVQRIGKVFLKNKYMIFNIFLVLRLANIQAFFAKLAHLSQIVSVEI